MRPLLDDAEVAARVFEHIDKGDTDLADGVWREPVANYRSAERLAAELTSVFHRSPTPFCPSVALPKPGSFVARQAGGAPLLAVRGGDGVVRVFRNACRHRGAEIACGAGRTKGFVCRYHGWAYGLDGTLRNIPHEEGFPGVDKSVRGLVEVFAEEKGGLVFVTQVGRAQAGDLDPALLRHFSDDLKLVRVTDQEMAANWKIVAEGFLEGYHIYATHRETFFPVQFDNLNVVERFGRNSRITFPYRNIEKLRSMAPEGRRVAGTLTFVYHLFPNVMAATFPHRTLLIILEPVGLERTRQVIYTLAKAATVESNMPAVEQDTDFVTAGAAEDRAIVESIQRGIASGANEHFEFGLFEGAIAHFHRNLQVALEVDGVAP